MERKISPGLISNAILDGMLLRRGFRRSFEDAEKRRWPGL